jgi:GntR family transcriptional repressor for pyruvate dehydrogenase complex
MVPHDVAARIQDQIRAGELEPGQRLASQRALSEQWGISRASLREALSVLETLGLVDIRPGLGVFVSEAPTPPLRHFAQSGYGPRDVYEARLALETMAAALAAQAHEEPELLRLRASVDALEAAVAAGDLVAMARADSVFHGVVMDAARNPLIAAMYRSAREAMEATQRAPMASRVSLAETLDEHRAILAAIRDRSAEAAAAAMRAHILGSARRLGMPLSV